MFFADPCTWCYNTNSKSARSLKYPPHSRALQFVERINAIFFTTHQLSKLLLISKRSPKELNTKEMNNILKFHQIWWTTNWHHIKFRFPFKLGLGFSWLMHRGPLPTQQHMAENYQLQITANSLFGKTKVEWVYFAFALHCQFSTCAVLCWNRQIPNGVCIIACPAYAYTIWAWPGLLLGNIVWHVSIHKGRSWK